jgi:hypothetical protein
MARNPKKRSLAAPQDSNPETLEKIVLQILPPDIGLPLITLFHDRKISKEAILRMNRNHFMRFGLDEESANLLFNSLRVFDLASGVSFTHPLRTIPKLMPSVAIIGTAGRYNSGMTMNLWMKMCQRAKDIILHEFQLHQHQVELISGGAAWAGEFKGPPSFLLQSS